VSNHSFYSLAEATQQTTIAYVTEDIYLYAHGLCWEVLGTLSYALLRVMSSHSCPE